MRRLLPALLLLTTAAPGFASPLMTRVATPPRAAALSHPGIRSAFVAVDRAAIARLRAGHGGRIDVPLPGGASAALQLSEFSVFTPDAHLVATGDHGEVPLTIDVTMFRGSVPGEAGSWAVLSMSGDQVMGTVETGGRRFAVAPATHVGGDHVVTDEATLPGHAPFECDADALPEVGGAPRAPGRYGIDNTDATATRMVCNVAIDTDYEYYSRLGSNLTTAQNYLTTLLGTVSAIYERDINTELKVSYVNIWTTAADPYDSSNCSAVLDEVKNYWIGHNTGISRTLVHHLSGKSLGCGIAWINVLCSSSFGYGVSPLDESYSYPNNSTTWDVNVIAHEMGHNFGSWHTHSCNWKTSGFIAAGTLDTCYAQEGSCGVGPPYHVPPNKGTIMSYCHLLGAIANTVRLEFHPACMTLMRMSVENAACMTAAPVQPPRSLAATSSAGGVSLTWTASPTSGVIRYDVYKSTTQLDLNPALLGSTTATNFSDTGDLGTFYYKVRAVRSADQSSFSNETKISPCSPAAPVSYTVGVQPLAIATGDVDGDGILDLVAANYGSDQVSVLRGNGSGGTGNGTFANAVNYSLPSPSSPQAVALADLNNDGAPDIVTGNYNAGTVSVLLNTGTGTFAAPTTVPVAGNPSGIVADDFNEDGIADLAVACQGGAVSVLIGSGVGGVGTGTFTRTDVNLGLAARALVSGDWNGDGIEDLAVLASSVVVLLGHGDSGRGDGTFQPPVSYDAGSLAYGITTGDFNDDGITDLAVANAGSNDVSMLIGHGAAGIGDGTFAAAISYPAGSQSGAVAFLDWNQDGITDLAVANNTGTSGTVSILTGKGAGGVGNGQMNGGYAFPAAAAPRAVVSGDFNGDGAADLAVANFSAGKVSVLLATCHANLPAGLAVTTPDGGESWSTPSERTVSWTRGTGALSVNVLLSRDGGLHWQTLASNVTRTAWTWSTSDPPSATALIRVQDPLVPQHRDQSNGMFTLLPAGVAVPVAAPAGLALERIMPNPATSLATLHVSLPSDAPATLELLDLGGRRMRSVSLAGMGAGRHAVPFVRAGLAPGLYMVRLSQGGASVSARVVFVH